MRTTIEGLALVTVLGAAFLAGPARAALGEQESSIARDRRALSAVARGESDRGTYRVHEIQKGATTIREFVSPDGVVFAIAWSGIANPDLGPLLGAYADEYRAAARAAPRDPGRRGGRVATDRVVVDRWGHMRDLHGRAYLPDRLPPGVSVDELR